MDPASPSPYCDPNCSHADMRTCKGLRHYTFADSGIQHVESAEKVQHSLVHDLWEVRMTTFKGYGGNGIMVKPPGINNAKVASLRETIAGNITFRCLTTSVRDMFQRRRTNPFYVNCTLGEFCSVFSHVPNNDPGITIRVTRRGAVVTITCMKTFLSVLDLHPSDVEM